jgi:hypothetical protein
MAARGTREPPRAKKSPTSPYHHRSQRVSVREEEAFSASLGRFIFCQNAKDAEVWEAQGEAKPRPPHLHSVNLSRIGKRTAWSLSNKLSTILSPASQVEVTGTNHRFLMLPLEPHESASRPSLYGFLPDRRSCADSEVAGANVCRRASRGWSTDSASRRPHGETHSPRAAICLL